MFIEDLFFQTADKGLFHTCFGVSREQLEDLLKRVEGHYESSYSDGSIKLEHRGRPVLTATSVLLSTLLRLRKKWSFSLIGWFFGLSATTLRERYQHMMNILTLEMEKEISLGDADTRLYHGQWHNDRTLRVVAALDGYLQLVTQPPDRSTRNLLQSGKEKDYCVSIFGLMGMDSKWLWRSTPIHGSIPDQTAILFSDSLGWVDSLSENEFIVADQAFYVLREHYAHTIIPDQYSSDPIDNRGVSSIRSIVEQGWQGLQEWMILFLRWKSNYSTWSSLQESIHQVVTVIMGLNNLYHQPYRTLDLEPSSITNQIYPRPIT